MNAWSHQSQLTLAALPNAAYWARRHVESVLATWATTIEPMTVNLVVTEFITNAVKATSTLNAEQSEIYAVQPTAIRYTALVRLGYVRLRLSYGNGRLLIEVWDKSEQAPIIQTPDLESEGGRGLFVVGSLASRWGWCLARGGGKIVWAELEMILELPVSEV